MPDSGKTGVRASLFLKPSISFNQVAYPVEYKHAASTVAVVVRREAAFLDLHDVAAAVRLGAVGVGEPADGASGRSLPVEQGLKVLCFDDRQALLQTESVLEAIFQAVKNPS